jgi:hypothetical protein
MTCLQQNVELTNCEMNIIFKMQQQIFHIINESSDLAVEASRILTDLFAANSKPFTERQLF